MSAAVPSDAGAMFVELNLADADRRHPAIAQLVGRGLMFALGDNRALIARRNGNGRICVHVGLRVAEDCPTIAAIDPDRPDEAGAALLTQFPGWSPSLLALIRAAEDRVAPRPIRAMPIGHRWPSRPGVTLIGDAAHLMSPFSGQGANRAMRDAADLALAPADGDDWPAAVRGFEATMGDRAEDEARGAAEALARSFATDGLQHALDHFGGHHGAE